MAEVENKSVADVENKSMTEADTKHVAETEQHRRYCSQLQSEEEAQSHNYINKQLYNYIILTSPVRRFASTGRGGVRRGGGQNILPSTPVAAKKTSAGGGGIRVSSQGEALEEAAVGTVGERGGRPGPHPKPSKGWGPSGACMRRAPLGLVGCLGRDRGKT